MSGTLTEEQLRRIEENKRKALARRAEKLGQTSPHKINPVFNKPKIAVGIGSGPKPNAGGIVSNTISVNPANVTHKGYGSGTSINPNKDCVGPGPKQSANQRFDVKGSNASSQSVNSSTFPVNSSNGSHSNTTKVNVGIAPRTAQSCTSSNSVRSEGSFSSLIVKNIQSHISSAAVTEKRELTVQERIEENRRRALEKLAEKKKSPAKVGPGAIVNSNSSAVGATGTSSWNSASKSGQNQQVKTSSTSFLNSFNKASADALNHKPLSVNQQPASSSHDRLDNAGQSKNMFQNTLSTNQSASSFNETGNVNIQSKNMFSGFGGKPVKGSCVLISRERFEVNVGFSAPLVQLFKTMDTKLYGEL